MPQNQVFGFQPPSRLEAVAQHADQEEDNCDHQSQSCSDSLAAVTPADGVFGSDRCMPNSKWLIIPREQGQLLGHRLRTANPAEPASLTYVKLCGDKKAHVAS